MKLSKSVIVAAPLALILATAAPARADLTGEAKDVEDALFELLSDTERYKQSVSPDGRSRGQLRGSFQQAPVDCAALVEQGVKAGIAPGDKLRGYPDPYLFKRAPEVVCAEYTKWRLLTEAAVLLYGAQQDHGIVRSMEPGDVTGSWAMAYDVKGKECHAGIETLVARGLATDVPVKVNGEVATVAALRAKYCQGLIDWAAQFAVATQAVLDAEAAALRAKYPGAKGDRLEYLMDADRRTVYGKGCAELELKGRIKAAVIYEVWEDNAKWTVRKRTFKKDKLVRSASRDFSKFAASTWRCW